MFTTIGTGGGGGGGGEGVSFQAKWEVTIQCAYSCDINK